MSVAAKVRAHKAAHPDEYCRVPTCLWRTRTSQGESPCRNHPPADHERCMEYHGGVRCAGFRHQGTGYCAACLARERIQVSRR